MFSDDFISEIFLDDRLKEIPINQQINVIRVIENVIEKRYFDDSSISKEDILNDIRR
jgi:hypothetical protein